MKTGILLVNLGTPDSYNPNDVKRYLNEFLCDKKVIDAPWGIRQLLVRGIIVPKRYKQSAGSYKEIWLKEGPPLLIYGLKMKEALEKSLGDDCLIELGMRYQTPSMDQGLNALLQQPLKKLIILPLFPQYATATTGSVFSEVKRLLKKKSNLPAITFIQHFFDNPHFINAWVEKAKEYDLAAYDRILFSYHSLPQRHLKRVSSNCCQAGNICCKKEGSHPLCYSAQCFATTYAITKALKLNENEYHISFQSRLGLDKWLEPYTQNTIEKFAKEGAKNILVFCPSFVCDCLETLHEIEIEYQELFKEYGGEKLTLVGGLNAESYWFDAAKSLISEYC